MLIPRRGLLNCMSARVTGPGDPAPTQTPRQRISCNLARPARLTAPPLQSLAWPGRPGSQPHPRCCICISKLDPAGQPSSRPRLHSRGYGSKLATPDRPGSLTRSCSHVYGSEPATPDLLRAAPAPPPLQRGWGHPGFLRPEACSKLR